MSAVFVVTDLSPALRLPGAVDGEGPDTGVPAHYGDPLREQRTLLSGAGIVDLSHRGVFTVSGADRLQWLHSLTSQHLLELPPYTPTTALVLSPQGHVEHAFRGYDDGSTFWGHTEPTDLAPLVQWLDSMRFMMRVEVSDLSAEWAVIARSADTTELVRRDQLAEAMASATPCGVLAYEALRIARTEPRFGIDTDHRTIPNEMGWIGTAVHLDKGCYRGQETIARVHNLGRPPRRLVLLHLDGSVDRLPGHRSEVVYDGQPVGFVGSAARHYELGPIALALVKRSLPVEAELLADGVAAAQEVVVDPDVGLHVRARL